MKRLFILIVLVIGLVYISTAQSARLINNGGLKLTINLNNDMFFRDVTNGTTNIIVEYHSGKKGRDVVYDVARFNADASRQYAYISKSITTADTDDTLQRMYTFINEGHGFVILTAIIRENGTIKNVKFGLQL